LKDDFKELDEIEPMPSSPIIITDNNWEQLDKGEWLIEFFAPWCPACRALQPRWDKLAKDVKDLNEMRVKIAKCDVTNNPWLTGRMMIASLPSIFHIKNKEYRKYAGSRHAEDIYDYLLKKKWQDTPVLEKWREPHGVAMTAMSGFYKMANLVQHAHDLMTIGYGFPVWASYVVFGLTTLACGLTAGLVIVCCMDCLSTPTTPERRAAIIEKNRKAREEKEKQAKLLEKLESEKKAREEEILRAEITSKQVETGPNPLQGGGDVSFETSFVTETSFADDEEEEEERIRRRKGYKMLEEYEDRSSEEDGDYDESEDGGGATESSEEEPEFLDEEDKKDK